MGFPMPEANLIPATQPDASVEPGRKRLAREIGVPVERIALPSQVHGSLVQVVSSPGIYSESDALVTAEANLFLSIAVADCVPIFLYDPATKSIAAVHAGWRGSREQILLKALRRMETDLGADVSQVLAYLGPCAGVCCYEVGEDVAKGFAPTFVRRRDGEKPHLDLTAYNISLLRAGGVRGSHIEADGRCTICDPAGFPSYRREGKRAGRMWGIIGRKDN